jgi:hypothetical protein
MLKLEALENEKQHCVWFLSFGLLFLIPNFLSLSLFKSMKGM